MPVLPGRSLTVRVVAKESRIGNRPITLPKGVTVTLKDNNVAVKVRPYVGESAPFYPHLSSFLEIFYPSRYK